MYDTRSTGCEWVLTFKELDRTLPYVSIWGTVPGYGLSRMYFTEDDV